VSRAQFLQAGRILISQTCREGEIELAVDEVNPGDIPPDTKDATRRLKDSKKAHSACGPPAQGPSTQERRRGDVSGDGAGAQDEMDKTFLTLEPTSELVDSPMQGLTYQNKNGNFIPVFAPCRSWTDTSAATSTTLVATASLKAIKATSRKPSSQSIVSRWLGSNFGSETSRKRKRTRANMETEGTVGQWRKGGSLLGSSINLMLSPEQDKDCEEVLPVGLIDGSHNDRQAVKRRRMEAPLRAHAGTCSPPMP
jgi:hypothetical protein